MAGYQEVHVDLLVQVEDAPPGEVCHHELILVLPTAVVAVELGNLLTKPILGKEVMQVGYHAVGPLVYHHPLVDQKVHLLGNALAVHSEDSAFPWRKEINWAGLVRVMGVVHL